MNEALQKAVHDMGFACEDLRAAMKAAGNDKRPAIKALLEKATELYRDVEALFEAHTAGNDKER